MEKTDGTAGTNANSRVSSRLPSTNGTRGHVVSGRNVNAVRLCSACRGDYEDPDASVADESLEPEDDEEGESDERRVS